MTVLFFARRFYPLIGGVEKHVLEIGRRLVKKGYKVIVVSEFEKNTNGVNYHSVSPSDTIEGIQIIRIKTGSEDRIKKFRIWIQLLKYFNIMKSADIIHCHDVFFWYLPFRFIFPLKKVYTTFHGYEGNDLPTKKAIIMHKISEKLSNGNICIGKFIEKWYETKSTYISYGAVDLSKNVNQNIDKDLIVFLGRLEEETGIMEYLKAFNQVVKNHKELKLLVLGDGSLMDQARKYVRDNKLSVEFKGFIQNTAKFVERAIFMFTSRYLGILESMINKKYIFAVYNNKIKEDYLKTTPFSSFISIGSNSDEIAKDLEKYWIDSEERNARVKNAFEWTKNQTWENLVNIYLSLWKVK